MTKLKKISGKRTRRLGVGPLYSVYQLFSSASTLVEETITAGVRKVFSVPIGGQGQGFAAGRDLTRTETNLETAGQLPKEQRYKLTDIGVTIYSVTQGTNAGDGARNLMPSWQLIQMVLKSMHLALITPQFTYHLGPAWFYPGGHEQPANVTEGNREVAYGAGITNRRRLKSPINIKGGATFSINFEFPRAVMVPIAVQLASQDIGIMFDRWGRWLQRV